MKKREKKMLKLLSHQQFLTLIAMDLLAKGYESAEDSTPAQAIPKLDIHAPIGHIEPTEPMRHYR